MKKTALVGSIWLLAFTLNFLKAQTAVWTYHNNNFRTGANTSESVLTPANVNATVFGKLFTYTVDGYVYAQPLYVPNVAIPGRGLHNVFFVATEHDSVYAFDADSAGAAGGLLWQTSLGVSAVTTTATFTNNNFGTRYNGGAYTDITPEVGITATPVIDTNTGTLYVDAFTGEIGGGVTNYVHRLHALNIATGAEQGNSPVVVTASVAGAGVDSVGGRVTFNAKQENARVALTLAGGIVYLTFTSYADTDPYHGWIIGYNAATLAQLTNYTFNTTPNSTTALYGSNAGEGGIWMSGNGLGVDANTNLYFFVGNGIFNVTNNSGKTEYGDSVMKLSTVNGLSVADYFTPYNQFTLAANDTDLGSGGMVLLPDQPGAYPHVLMGAGKAGVIYTLNRDQLTTSNTHFNPSGSTDSVLQSTAGRVSASFGTPAYFNGKIYCASSGDYLKALSVANSLLTSTALTNTARTFSFPGATVSISANGTSNGIVWAIQYSKGVPAVLVACNATNFTTELYNSSQATGSRDVPGNAVKFAAPTVADGKVIIGTIGSVSVYGLLAGTFAFNAPSYSIQEANTSITIGVNRLGGTSGAVSVNYATVDGSAMAGVDYSAVSGTLNWASGDATTKYFSVPILATGVVNPNKTINLALSNPAGNAALAPQSAVVLSITPTPTEAWKLAQFGANANNPAVAGDAADPDNDGIVNLFEYAYATDPQVYNSNPFTANLAGQQFQLHFPRNTSATDITYVLQTSASLTTWSDLLTYTAAGGWQQNLPGATVVESGVIGTAPNAFVNVTVTSTTNVLTSGAACQFLRLEIHR